MLRATAATTVAAAASDAAGPSAPEMKTFTYREYSRCLPDALRSLASAALEIRNAQLSAVSTPASIAARQHWARDTFWNLIGGRRERIPITVHSAGRLERQRYTVEKIAYQSRPGEWISANLYLPKAAAERLPAVLFQAGHTKNGKAGYAYQCCCQGLVQLGFVVLTFDPIGQGERTNYPGPDGLTRFAVADDEHTVPGRQMLLAGETMTRLQLEDAIASLDVLAGHARVDPSRIGAAGQSGGGTLTMMLAAVDERIAAAVVCCGNTENVACQDFRPPGSVDDAEQNFLDRGVAGFDRWDLLWPFAPRPLLVLASAKDFFDTYSPNYLRNGREELQRLAQAYGVLGRSEQIRYYESPLPHALSPVLRLELYRWAAQWLKREDTIIDIEPPVAPENDRDLWATSSGSVARDLESLTAFQLLKARSAGIKTPSAPPDLQQILRISSPRSRQKLNVLSTVRSRSCLITAAEVQSAPGVWVPLWIFTPPNPAHKMMLVLDPKGRHERWQEGDLYQQLAEQVIVCVPDLRGIGDLQPEYSSGAPKYAASHQQEEAYAWASLIFGRSLVAQRVEDLLAVVETLSQHFDNAPLGLLAAQGSLTIPALCAAALDPRIAAIYLSQHLISWRSITEQPDYAVPFANFIPGILKQTDLPEIAAGLAPRSLVLGECVDSAGKPASEQHIREIYSGTHIRLAKSAAWNRNTLLSFL